ncbi:MAG: peptidoglycan DD-metalloendopeptidase family protein [Acetobacter sp.]|nr:peptidoglycan DD-metalloendopeptidase family protein [Acetobacter sp.]
MKKVLVILLILPLLAGCYARSQGIPLFNSYGYNYTPNSVVVQKGDTLYSLSRKYEVPLRSLIEENNLSAPYALSIGQNLKLPVRQTYTVAKGDTLYSISKKYNVDITSLSRLNDLNAPYALSVGQVLSLPETLASTTNSTSKTVARKDNSTLKKKSKATPIKTPKTTVKAATTSKKITKSAPRKTVSTYRKTKFIWPVNGTVVSNFGIVGKGRKNDGINIKAAIGTNVKAADKGIVAYAGNELKGFGNLVLIKHADGYITAYAHNERLYVKKGQKVLRGEKIATVGSTGSVNTPQLHFEVRAGKKAVNPRSYLP